MASEWYYAKDGQQYGPVSSRDLKQLAEQGKLLATDVVWKEGMPDWRPAAQVKGLVPEQLPTLLPVDETAPVPRGGGRRRSRSIVGPCLLILAALTLISTMFVPWWSIRLRPIIEDEKQTEGRWARDFWRKLSMSERGLDDEIKRYENTVVPTDETKKDERQRTIGFYKAAKKSKKWWEAHLKKGDTKFSSRFREIAEQVDDDKRLSLTVKIWGWSELYAILSLVFGAVVLLLAIVFLSVPPIRNWSWIVSAVALIMGILALVFSLIWIFKAPGQDVKGVLTQGIVFGPWLMLGGGAAYFLVGLFDTIFGIMFAARRR